MNVIYAAYNIRHNSIDIYTYAGGFLRIDCNKAEEGLKITPYSECALNALALDEPLASDQGMSLSDYKKKIKEEREKNSQSGNKATKEIKKGLQAKDR